jgi:hypothetical protein
LSTVQANAAAAAAAPALRRLRRWAVGAARGGRRGLGAFNLGLGTPDPLHGVRRGSGRLGRGMAVPRLVLGLWVTGAAFVVVATAVLQAIVNRLDPRARR